MTFTGPGLAYIAAVFLALVVLYVLKALQARGNLSFRRQLWLLLAEGVIAFELAGGHLVYAIRNLSDLRGSSWLLLMGLSGSLLMSAVPVASFWLDHRGPRRRLRRRLDRWALEVLVVFPLWWCALALPRLVAAPGAPGVLLFLLDLWIFWMVLYLLKAFLEREIRSRGRQTAWLLAGAVFLGLYKISGTVMESPPMDWDFVLFSYGLLVLPLPFVSLALDRVLSKDPRRRRIRWGIEIFLAGSLWAVVLAMGAAYVSAGFAF